MPARPDAPLAEYLYLLAGDPEDFVAACADLLPADIVEALNDLPPEAASKVVGALPFHTAVEVFDQPEL
jgi:Mg/Co/Ni transporter MgtE